MTILDCLREDKVTPLMIAEKSRTKLPRVTAELIKLHRKITGILAKQLLTMEPPKLPAGRAEEVMQALEDGMDESDALVLGTAYKGVLNYRAVAKMTGLSELAVRAARSRMLRMAGLRSFEDVVQIAIFFEGEVTHKKKK